MQQKQIRLLKDTPLLRGTLPAGTVLNVICVSAISCSGKTKSWDVHGLSVDSFEFVHEEREESLSGLDFIEEVDEMPSFV